MGLFLWILLLASSYSHLAGDDPDWVSNYGKSAKYPTELYLTGFGSHLAKEKNAHQIAEDDARAALARTVTVQVQSQVVNKLEEQGKKASEYFSSVTQSSTSLQIQGVKTETFKKDKTLYALAYVSRADLTRIYQQKKNELQSQIKKTIEAAKQDESNKNIEDAAAKYLSLFPLYDELKETMCILLVADSKASAATVMDDPLMMGKTESANRVEQLLAQSINSVDDAARAIAYQISKQIKQPSGKLLVAPFTYQDTRMSSSLARYLQRVLESQMQKWDIAAQAKGFIPKSSQVTRDLATESGAQNLLEGSYWELGQQVKIIARLHEVTTGEILACAEVLMRAALVQAAHLDLKPQNAVTALADQKAFKEDEVISSDIHLEVFTNKGNENLLFTEGEMMKVYVRVNRAAHVRLMYNIASGERTLLFNDYYIDESKANQAVEIPAEFECASPFGAESMLAFARLDAFPPVKTFDKDGYVFLEEQNAGKAAVAARGMKRKEVDTNKVKQTETGLTITTMEK